jgi:hypothetical protein
LTARLVNIGTEKKTGDTTTVTVDQSKLAEYISGAASGSSVIVQVVKRLRYRLPDGSNIADMATKA